MGAIVVARAIEWTVRAPRPRRFRPLRDTKAAMSDNPPEKSFGALFEETSQRDPRRRRARIGETLEVVVIQVGKEVVFVDLPGQRQGFIDGGDLRAPDGSLRAAVGDTLSARVIAVDPEHGVRLVPTVRAAVAAGATVSVGENGEAEPLKISLGQVVSGEVSRIEAYGLFIQIDGTKGRTGRGLAPTVELGVARGADLRKAFPLGTKVRAKVLEIAEGRIRLSLRALKDDEERAEFEGFRKNENAEAAQGFGTFGDLLKSQKASPNWTRLRRKSRG
jgi:small subunit ribosomal protein S1